MPVLGPGGTQIFTVDDLANEVIIKVENRTTDRPRAWQWIVDSLLELSENQDLRNEFCELESEGPLFNLTSGTQEYPQTNFITPGTFNAGTLDFLIWLDPGTNSKRNKLRMMNYQEADEYLSVPSGVGLPTYWYRFGLNFGFYLTPNANYQVQARFLQLYPIAAAIQFTPIILPRDWWDVLVLAATERGWIELEEFGKAEKIHELLYGDPKKITTGGRPTNIGLIKSRKLTREREAWRDDMPLRPCVRRISH